MSLQSNYVNSMTDTLRWVPPRAHLGSDLRISPWYRWHGAVPAYKCHISHTSIGHTYLRVNSCS